MDIAKGVAKTAATFVGGPITKKLTDKRNLLRNGNPVKSRQQL
jgi:hypothetical protein